MVTKTTKLSVILLAGLFSACSTVKDVTNVDLWPFGKGGDQGHEYLPANSTAYTCDGNKKFYVRYLDKGASVWLILPDREVALAQVGSSKVYSNGISKLDLSGDQATLDVNETTKYVGCKANSVASVSKIEAKPAAVAATEVKSEAKPATKVEAKPETSEKGWFDWMKFWESDDKPKQAEPVKAVEKAKVAEPVPALSVAKEDVPAAKISEPQMLEPVVEAAKIEPAAEVAEPSDVAEEQAAPAGDAQVAVAKTVEAWASAWRTKNANAYLNFYSAKFKPEGMSKKVWEAQRKQRVGANPADIALTIDKLSITADAKNATATFAQHYASGKYSDDVVKVLSFENVNGQWLIVKESVKAAK